LGVLAVLRLDVHQRGDVAPALRDRHHQPEPRLPALLLGHVPRHDLGLGRVRRHHRAVPHPVVPVRPGPPDDLDLRNADHRPLPQGRRAGGGCAMTPPIYGLMAEFHDPDSLVAAPEKVHAAGYTTTDAFTPYPIEALSEALHLKRSH